MQGLEKLPQERRAYYSRLHERLTDICCQALSKRDWQLVYEAAGYHLKLQHLCIAEGVPPSRGEPWKCFNIILQEIEKWCSAPEFWF